MVNEGLAVQFEDAVVGDQVFGAPTEIGIGGEVYAAPVTVGPVVLYGALAYLRRAFQQQAAAAVHVRSCQGVVVLYLAVVDNQFVLGTAPVPAHRAAIVVGEVAILQANRDRVLPD